MAATTQSMKPVDRNTFVQDQLSQGRTQDQADAAWREEEQRQKQSAEDQKKTAEEDKKLQAERSKFVEEKTKEGITERRAGEMFDAEREKDKHDKFVAERQKMGAGADTAEREFLVSKAMENPQPPKGPKIFVSYGEFIENKLAQGFTLEQAESDWRTEGAIRD